MTATLVPISSYTHRTFLQAIETYALLLCRCGLILNQDSGKHGLIKESVWFLILYLNPYQTSNRVPFNANLFIAINHFRYINQPHLSPPCAHSRRKASNLSCRMHSVGSELCRAVSWSAAMNSSDVITCATASTDWMSSHRWGESLVSLFSRLPCSVLSLARIHPAKLRAGRPFLTRHIIFHLTYPIMMSGQLNEFHNFFQGKGREYTTMAVYLFLPKI